MKLRQFLSNSGFVLGIIIIAIFALIALAAPLLAQPTEDDPYFLRQFGYAGPPEPPSSEHLLGLMQDRYDVIYGLIWGTRVAFKIGLLITLGRVLVGVPLGVISGYYGGLLDSLIMRATDAFLAFPVVAGVMLLMTVSFDYWEIRLGEGDTAVIIGLIMFGWIQYARLIRGNVLAERGKEYVKAAVCVGAADRRIILRHVLPNSTQGLLVMIASDIGTMVITVASLTFIGFTGDAPIADWGMMLRIGRNWIVSAPGNAFEYWYTYVPIIVAIVLFSIGWNLIGDGLRDVLDPKLRSAR
jgi:peptide/nickel transport system permease protein